MVARRHPVNIDQISKRSYVVKAALRENQKGPPLTGCPARRPSVLVCLWESGGLAGARTRIWAIALAPRYHSATGPDQVSLNLSVAREQSRWNFG